MSQYPQVASFVHDIIDEYGNFGSITIAITQASTGMTRHIQKAVHDDGTAHKYDYVVEAYSHLKEVPYEPWLFHHVYLYLQRGYKEDTIKLFLEQLFSGRNVVYQHTWRNLIDRVMYFGILDEHGYRVPVLPVFKNTKSANKIHY